MQSLPTLVRGHVARSAEGRDGPLMLGRYRLLERLGAGGFGVVWRAHDEREDREVALKRIPLGPGADPARAAREALAVGRLSHPAIVALYETSLAEDAFVLVSELVEGATLAEVFQREPGDLALLQIVECVAEALVHAHARGVIHRDVKPQNILVPDRPAHGAERAKLTDFGGAQLAGEDALTRTGDVVGTLAYMAPEQADGRGAGPSADLYSLALVLYEGLTGANPVRGATPAETARRLGQRAPALGPQRPDLPPALARAIDTALDPRPQQRGRLEDLIVALAGAGGHTRLAARPARRRAPRRALIARPAAPGALHGDDLGASPARRPAALTLPLGRTPRLAGALAAGLLMTAALHVLLLERNYAPAGGVLAALAVALAPRAGWLAGAAFVVIWLAVTGAPGTGLVVACAALPVTLLLRRPGPAWSLPALAPLAGLVGLGALFPALAGQARRWPRRAALGALGFWWLMLAQPVAGRRLWLGPPPGSLSREAWQHTLAGAARHALEPALVPAMLAGALLWALGAVALPWAVRGRSAVRDIAAAAVWAALLAAGAVVLEHGLIPAGGAPWPRGGLAGSAGAALLAVGSRAVRGPTMHRGAREGPLGRRGGGGEEPF